jgi:uncharacterized protein
MDIVNVIAAVVGLAVFGLGFVLWRDSRAERKAQTRIVAPAIATQPEPADQSGKSARFEVFKDRANEWRWRLRAVNGRVIADSGEGYKQRARCLGGIAAVQRIAADARIHQ